MSVRVYIDRKELIGYTSLSLSRKKDEFTGSLNISVFMGRIPSAPIFVDATKGREILVYVGGFLAFTGVIDRRNDKGTSDGETSKNLSISADSYTVSFTARGKTKYLIDSSHQHETGTIKKTTNKKAFELLVGPWSIKLDWQATEIDLDRVRLRDGGRVVDELQRLANQCSLYVHETAQGVLRVTDKAGTAMGEPIALGTNILSFSTDQAENSERSQVTVKGHITERAKWGDVTVLPTFETVANSIVENFTPVTVQLFGNATPELIQRRGQYEANRRSAASKRVEVDVFHVQQSNGRPWDIGTLHQVTIPVAGVNDVLEVTELTYTVEADKTLKTKLVLTPPPSSLSGAKGFMGGVGAQPTGQSKTYAPKGAWQGPSLEPKTTPNNAVGGGARNQVSFLGGSQPASPPDKLRGPQ